MKTLNLVLIISACASTKEVKHFTIIGVAENMKAGAFVVNYEEQRGYYVEGIHRWEESIIGKKIKVSGELVTTKLKRKPKIQGIAPQQIIGKTKKTIYNPKWELVPDSDNADDKG